MIIDILGYIAIAILIMQFARWGKKKFRHLDYDKDYYTSDLEYYKQECNRLDRDNTKLQKVISEQLKQIASIGSEFEQEAHELEVTKEKLFTANNQVEYFTHLYETEQNNAVENLNHYQHEIEDHALTFELLIHAYDQIKEDFSDIGEITKALEVA